MTCGFSCRFGVTGWFTCEFTCRFTADETLNIFVGKSAGNTKSACKSQIIEKKNLKIGGIMWNDAMCKTPQTWLLGYFFKI